MRARCLKCGCNFKLFRCFNLLNKTLAGGYVRFHVTRDYFKSPGGLVIKLSDKAIANYLIYTRSSIVTRLNLSVCYAFTGIIVG